jgi:drug/metabolite transporter (DMT)-like permease
MPAVPPIYEDAERSTFGVSASVLAAFCWGFGGIFAVLTFASGMVDAFYRLWIDAVLLTALTYALGQRLHWSVFRHAWFGGIVLGADMMMFYIAVRLTSILDVTVIGAFQPAIVLLAAPRVFGEHVAKRDIFWIILAMVGVSAAVIGPSSASHHRMLGDLFAVGALLTSSAYWLAAKRASERTSALEYTTGITIVAAITCSFIILGVGDSIGHVRLGDWIWIALLAIVPGSAHFLMNWAHRLVKASVSSAISCLAPLVASVLAIPILGQSLSYLQLIGEAIGLVGIGVVAARNRAPMESS